MVHRQQIGRRTVLGMLAAAGGVAAATPSHAAPRPLPSRRSRLGLEVAGVLPVVTFEADWSAARSFDVPVALRLGGYAGARDVLTLTVTFDRRVLEVTPQAVAAADGLGWSTGAARVVETAGDAATLRVEVPRPAARARTGEGPVVLLPLRPRRLYPAENVGRVVPLTVELSRDGGRERRSRVWRAPETLTPGPVWGVEVSAAFAASTTTPTRVPTAVRVESVGPHPVPAGSLVRVETDRAVSGLAVAEATLDGVPVPLSGRLERGAVTSVLDVPVPEIAAGRVLLVHLAATAVEPVAEPAAASVRVVAAAGVAGHARATGAALAVDSAASGPRPIPPSEG
ncbi:hypothetical protein [Cellulomonas phragmiteti]|uniref:Uncharacterized protein n=1 Tax=Cellulomonas phragmiteti TaxID=478780 RepID=A0ABQ4DNJ8_9CELL|nr:hypothetical protein [Cellulomonas phragmiteti]GIG40918.1 hypothetical protein Cph01nite_26800 [Cellulomonas phragmiteti]